MRVFSIKSPKIINRNVEVWNCANSNYFSQFISAESVNTVSCCSLRAQIRKTLFNGLWNKEKLKFTYLTLIFENFKHDIFEEDLLTHIFIFVKKCILKSINSIFSKLLISRSENKKKCYLTPLFNEGNFLIFRYFTKL